MQSAQQKITADATLSNNIKIRLLQRSPHLIGVPNTFLKKLQNVQNTVVRHVSGPSRYTNNFEASSLASNTTQD